MSAKLQDSMLLFRDGVTNSLGKPVPEEAVNIFQVPLKTDPLYDTVCRDLLSKVPFVPLVQHSSSSY